jgi:ABC-2 type transport system permease protein
VRLYWELARRGYRRYAAYPAATWAGLFTNAMFGFLKGYILLALFRHRDDIGGYDAQATITYVWLTQALIATVAIWGWAEFAQRIKTGDVAIDLARPAHPLLTGLATDLGRGLYHALFRGIPPLVLGALFFDLTAPRHVGLWIAFLASVVLAIAVSFAWRFLYNLIPFWTGDYRGVTGMAMIVANLLSGFIIPLTFFPGWLRTLAYATPFPSLIQIPVDLFVGKTEGWAILSALAMQAGWLAGLLLLGAAIYAAGTRRLVIQGG